MPRFKTTQLAAFTLCFAVAGPVLAEDFDQSGSALTYTCFPDETHSGGTVFVRETVQAATGAPNTAPALPINVGGDKECRYYEADYAPSHAYALMTGISENDFADGVIDGTIAAAMPVPWGSRDAGFVLRAQEGGNGMNCYFACFYNYVGNTGHFAISRLNNGIGQTLLDSDDFPVDLQSENYRIRFRADGTMLTAWLWRVHVVDGAVVETPIDLNASEPGVQNVISAEDDELSSGRAGLFAFARGENSVFFDDVHLTLADCGTMVDAEQQYLGTNYGPMYGDVPGDVLFTEDSVPVSLEEYEDAAGTQHCVGAAIDLACYGFGFNFVMQCGSASLVYDLSDLGVVHEVKLEYYEANGPENLQVNGAALYVGEIENAPTNIAPGVTLTVTQTPAGAGTRGTIRLIGPVQRLLIGGSFIELDNVCIDASDCIGDLDGDDDVDQSDLGILLASYGIDDGGDIDGDGDTDQSDLGMLLAGYGQPC